MGGPFKVMATLPANNATHQPTHTPTLTPDSKQAQVHAHYYISVGTAFRALMNDQLQNTIFITAALKHTASAMLVHLALYPQYRYWNDYKYHHVQCYHTQHAQHSTCTGVCTRPECTHAFPHTDPPPLHTHAEKWATIKHLVALHPLR